jgi:6-phosphogluconolactonase
MTMTQRSILAALLSLSASFTAAAEKPAPSFRVYLGTYTQNAESKGIYTSVLDTSSGKLAEPVLAATVENPSFLVLHPNGKSLYAASEVKQGEKMTGLVYAFAIDTATGALRALNHQSSEGGGPCHITVSSTGKHLLVANYSAGNIASLPIAEDGSLGAAVSVIQHEGSSVNKDRQKGPHAHAINLDPAGRFAFANDLGIDKVLAYAFDDKGTLKAQESAHVSVPPGSGPRHFTFHPSGRYAYVNNELFSNVTAFRYDADKGKLEELHTLSTLPADFTGTSSTAEVQCSADGRFVYVSNRGHDSIAIFSVDEKTGKLTAAGHVSTQGKTPRNFRIDPSGRYLVAANQGTGNVVVFAIDPKTGGLTPTGSSINVARPVCVKFAAMP